MPTITMLQIKQDVLRVLNKRDEAVRILPIPMTVNAGTPGSTTTINDSRLGHGTGQANRYDGRNIEIVERPAAATEATSGETAGIDDAGFDQVDTITFSPALTFLPEASQNYLIYGLGLSKEVLEEAVNEVLRETHGPHLYFPSLVPDSDLSAGDITHWAALAGGAPGTTHEYDATVGLLGAGSIHGVATAIDQGFTSDAIDVHETESMIVSVFVKVNVGSVKISINDLTDAGADITPSPITVDRPVWTEVRFNVAIPADCEQVAIRFTALANLDDWYMGAHVILQATSGRSYTVPTWLTRESQILDWVYMPRGIQGEDANEYLALGEKLKAEQEVQILRDERGVHPFRIQLTPANDRPVAMIVQRAFDEITLGVLGTDVAAGSAGTNEATTYIDRDYIRSKVVATLLRDFGDNGYKFWARNAAIAAELAHYGEKGIRVEPTPTVAM